MTKNKAMRLGSVMLVLALLTTCAISGTFAKYTASSVTNDTARVAYWGFSNPETTTLNLFKDTYSNAKSGGTVDEVSNIVAPGTSNTADLKFNYATSTTITAPEVNYTFNVEATNTGDTTFLDDAAGFNWTLKIGNDTETTYDKTADLLTALNALSVADTIEAGNLPSTVFEGTTAKTVTIGWKWDYTDTTSAEATATRDADDTDLGNATDANLQNVKLNIKVTATQTS